MHPDYNSNTVDQDFALLRMANPIDWASNPNIRPACLPEYTAGDYDQWMSTVTGWGTTSSGGSTSSTLLEVDVQVISNSQCNAAYGGITNNMLCAQDASGNGGSDACQGDSGGPLVSCGEDGNCGTTPGQNYDLIGVVSFGIGCAEKDYPGVYARTTAALDWIYTNAMPFETCSRGVHGGIETTFAADHQSYTVRFKTEKIGILKLEFDQSPVNLNVTHEEEQLRLRCMCSGCDCNEISPEVAVDHYAKYSHWVLCKGYHVVEVSNFNTTTPPMVLWFDVLDPNFAPLLGGGDHIEENCEHSGEIGS